MAYDSKYYSDKKMKVIQGFIKSKDKVLSALVELAQEIVDAQNKYTEEMKEIEDIMKANEKPAEVEGEVKAEETAPEKTS